MKYDDASWHSGGEGFPKSSPDEYGGVHIALFLKWCFIQGWAGELHLELDAEEVQKVIDGEMLATDFFFKNCDGKLTIEAFTQEGNQFAKKYYGDNNIYLFAYANKYGEKLYAIDEKEINFQEYSFMIDNMIKNN